MINRFAELQRQAAEQLVNNLLGGAQRGPPAADEPSSEDNGQDNGQDDGVNFGRLLSRWTLTPANRDDFQGIYRRRTQEAAASSISVPSQNTWKGIRPDGGKLKQVNLSVLQKLLDGLLVFDKAFFSHLRDDEDVSAASVADIYVDLSIWIRNYIRSTLEMLQSASTAGGIADGYAMGIVTAMSDPLAPLSRDEALGKLDVHRRLLETSLLRSKLEKLNSGGKHKGNRHGSGSSGGNSSGTGGGGNGGYNGGHKANKNNKYGGNFKSTKNGSGGNASSSEASAEGK